MPLSREAQAALEAARRSKATLPGRADAQQLALHLRTPEPINPIDDAGELTGDLQADATAEVDALDKALQDPSGFQARALKEDARRAAATDPDFYCVVTFISSADRQKFLERAGLVPAELYGDIYIDGYQAAEKLGIDMNE